MRGTWLAVLLIGALAGCREMDDAGGFSALFATIPVEEPAPPASPPKTSTPDGTDAAPATATTPPRPVDPFFPPELDPTATIPSPASPAAPLDGSDPLAALMPPPLDPTAAPTAVVEVAPPTRAVIPSEPPPSPMGAPGAGMAGGGGGWPLRLIKTLPDTQPPRAIIGLPDGEEIVVSPGTMIPEHHLVVMAIGPKAAELAYISPSGDHAAVRTVSLQTQY